MHHGSSGKAPKKVKLEEWGKLKLDDETLIHIHIDLTPLFAESIDILCQRTQLHSVTPYT